MVLPKIPSFEELLKRVKQPKVEDIDELDATQASKFGWKLPTGWKLKRLEGVDSLISPRGLTFNNLKLDEGKITDFQAFRGDKPVNLKGFPRPPLAWTPPTLPETTEGLKISPMPPTPKKPEGWQEWEARGRWGLPPQELPEIREEPELMPPPSITQKISPEEALKVSKAFIEGELSWKDYQTMIRTGQTIEWTRLQEQIRTGGIPLEQYEALSEEQKGMLVKQGEYLSPTNYPGEGRRMRIEGEPVSGYRKFEEAVIAAGTYPLVTIAGVGVSASDIAALALIGFGIYQVGNAGWNMLLDRVLRKPGDLNLLGRKLTEAGLNRNLNILERQSGVKIPAETRTAFINRYLNDMAAAWARNVASQGKAVNTQALQIASQNTYTATANAVNREIQALIPKGTQTGAMAMGGVPEPTIQSVAAKIMNQQPLTAVERQLYANESQAIEDALKAQVPTPTPTTEAVGAVTPVTPEVTPKAVLEVPTAEVVIPEATKAQQVEYTKKMRPFLDEADIKIKKANDDFMAGKTSLAENQAQRDAINVELDKQADIIRAEMGFPAAIPKAEVTPQPPPEAVEPKISPVTEEVRVIPPTEPTRAEIAKQAEQLKAKLAAQPVVEAPAKPQPVVSPVERRAEIKSLLTEPAKNLPKGTTKITLRKELAEINKSLIPQEKALRSQIMATVRAKSLGITQSRNIFREAGGSRYLTNQELTQLEKTLKAVERARPITIKGKKVITLKREALIQSAKKDLIDQGILTKATYKDILESLKLSTDKYVDSQNFITNAEGGDIIRTMRNIAILNPLGELKFGKPTALKYLTSQTYYAQVLGLKPLTNPLELAKVDFDLAYRAMSNAVDQKLKEVNKAWGVSRKEILESKAKNIPTKGSSTLRDLLDKNEEAPSGLTAKQKELFNWFRNLNRSIINGENEVRRAMGVEEISYRQAYVRHIPDAMAWEIINGTHPIPPSLQYWSRKLVSKKIFNPMELHRQLSDDLANLYSKDLAFATKNMVYTGLKEIHLAQPLRAFTERMGALSDVMPASTRKWVTDYVNQVIKGQQTEWDESINAIVTESGIGGVIDTFLKPFNRTLGQRPVTRLAQTIGNATIYSVLGLPRPRLARLMIRNLFQRTQELALHGVVATLRSFLPDPKGLKELKSKSRYLKSYTGIEEWPTDLMGKVAKIPLAPYQFTATLNADRGMSAAYYDYEKFITNKKYKDMVGRTGNRWPSEQRTYTEEEGFLYPEEQKILLEEMELATRATQYQYIGLGMPEIFRHKTLIPFTRLQSWWMNHFTMFHREAFHRFAYGETMSGYPLPWSSRVNWLKYLLLGGAILTSMGYTSSYLIKVLPHNESPFAQFAIGLFKYVSATSDWTRAQAKWDMQSAWKAMVPGALAADEIQKLWTGETPLWQTFFYGREEQGPPPRVPDYGFPIEPSALKQAETAITESISKLGKEDVVARTEAVDEAIEAGASKEKLREINAKDWTYDITSLRRDISDATRNLEEDDIGELEPIVGNYVELKEQDKAYELLGDKEQGQYIKDNPEYMTNRLFWGEITTIPSLITAEALVAQANKYNIPLDMIPAFQLTDKGKERIPSNRNLWEIYFTYYDLPGTSYLNMTQGQVDAGQLPEKYRSEWEAYNKLKTDTARALYRKAHREASYSKWRDDFRRANPEFDQWLIDQEYNKPLAKRAIRRTGRVTGMTLAGGFGAVSARPRRAAIKYPKFKKPRISTGITVRAPSAPGV